MEENLDVTKPHQSKQTSLLALHYIKFHYSVKI